MIWVLGIALAVVVGFYLAAPFLSTETATSKTNEIEAYRNELRAVERSEEPEKVKRAILQSRLLQAAKADAPEAGARSMAVAGFICVGLVGGSAGLYGLLGSPNFTPETRQAPPPIARNSTTDFASLLPRFEARLAEDPNDATGWTLYGRTLMLVGDTTAGLRAYERALELNDIPEIRNEYEAAQKFAAQTQSGPSAEDIAAMQSLSQADRTAAIEGMVEGLRARLETDPSDTAGWVRLLRSRKVLGQTEAARADIEALRSALPNEADAIIAQSGWTD
ncbi:MAG: c-type cytochrome biogenesis protein CcmI [Litorimonas sp.]